MMKTNGKKAVARGALLPAISGSDFDRIISSLEVSFVKLAECVIAPGWPLTLVGTEAWGIQYNVSGRGLMVSNGRPPIDVRSHTLVILPGRTSITLEGAERLRNITAGGALPQEVRPAVPGAGERPKPANASMSTRGVHKHGVSIVTSNAARHVPRR